MNNGTYLYLPFSAEGERASGNEIAVSFSDKLSACVQEYRSGGFTFVFLENLHTRWGPILLDFFRGLLIDQVGEPVDVTCITDYHGSKTIVKMRQLNVPQHHPDVQPISSVQTASSDLGVNTAAASAGGKKKVPRPMNSWMLFRDEKHKEFKQADPNISVQQISKHCSELWRSLPDQQKKRYQTRAAQAAEQHKRIYPDYKYQPRKAGEKKKRQSRKAKQAAAAAAAESETLTFASAADVSMTGSSNINNSLASDLAQVADSAAVFGLEQSDTLLDDQLHATELIRQDRLHTEFTSEFSMNMPINLFGGEAFGFRTGADGSATLPLFLSGRQLMKMLRTVKEPALQRAITTQLLLAPPNTFGLSTDPKGKKPKAVNGFVGFRCYYIKIPAIMDFPMKSMSGVLGALWHQDENQQLWAIMSQAWTIVRDQVGDGSKARRDEFFLILLQKLPIPSPTTYLEDHGWKVIMNEAGFLTLERVPNPPPVQSINAAGTSVEELVAYVLDSGFAGGHKVKLNASLATFLGGSTQQDANGAPQWQTPAYAKFPDPRIRVAEKKKRRFEMRTIANPKGGARLHSEVQDAHMTYPSNEVRVNEPAVVVNEPNAVNGPFAHFSATSTMQQDAPSAGPFSNISSTSMANYTNPPIEGSYNAFRAGANQHATLPPFDSAGY